MSFTIDLPTVEPMQLDNGVDEKSGADKVSVMMCFCDFLKEKPSVALIFTYRTRFCKIFLFTRRPFTSPLHYLCKHVFVC